MSEIRISTNIRKRRLEVRRNIKLMIIAFILVCFFVIGFGTFTSLAKEQSEEVFYKYYTRIEIQANDTLWSIANQHKENHNQDTQSYINEIITINNMREDEIISGEHLIVPYYSDEIY